MAAFVVSGGGRLMLEKGRKCSVTVARSVTTRRGLRVVAVSAAPIAVGAGTVKTDREGVSRDGVEGAEAASQSSSPSGWPTGLKRNLLMDVMRKEWLRVLAAFLSLFIATAAALFIPLAFGQVIRSVITLKPGGGFQNVIRALSFASVLYAVEPLATTVWRQTISHISEKLFRKLKTRLFDDIVHQDVSYFDEHSSGELASVVSRDVGELRDLLWGNISRDRGVRALLEAVGVLCVITALTPQLAVVFALTIPTLALLVAELGKRLRYTAAAEGAVFGGISSIVSEVFGGIKTVKSFGAEDKELNRLDNQLEKAMAVSERGAQLRTQVEALNRVALYVSLLAVSLRGGQLVLAGTIGPTMLVSFIGYVFSLNFAMQGISYTASDIGRALGIIERIRKFLGNKASIGAVRDNTRFGTKTLSEVQGRIVFRDVHFNYPLRPDLAVLKGLSFTLERNTVTALVGPSGAGKSTCVALLSRFYPIAGGNLTLDGVDVTEFDQSWYPSQVALVSQEPTLFTGTVWQNIAYGSTGEVSDEKVREAARLANAEEFILKLPNGYDTELGESGGLLSGGQRQRIAIARAVLKNAPVLILDEATSALDTASEKLVQEALERLMVGRTSLVIAHRLSTVVNADKICVLNEGVVAESGTHAELMRGSSDSIYKQLMKTQMDAFIQEKAL